MTVHTNLPEPTVDEAHPDARFTLSTHVDGTLVRTQAIADPFLVNVVELVTDAGEEIRVTTTVGADRETIRRVMGLIHELRDEPMPGPLPSEPTEGAYAQESGR